jgi:flagellar motor switch protein FliN/FliY
MTAPDTQALPDLPKPELADLGQGAAPGQQRDLRLLADVQVALTVELGRVTLPMRELLSLAPGAVLELDRAADAPVDVLVNGTLVAQGEVVVIDGELGVRITALADR